MDNQKELLSKISNDNINIIKKTFSEITYYFNKLINSTTFIFNTKK